MGILMKIIILIFTILSFVNAQSYTFLLKKYNKQIELESKIVFNIADSIIKEKIKLFIPQITKQEIDVYSKLFLLEAHCEKANFIFVKNDIDDKNLCIGHNKIYFTNNYNRLLSSEKYIGAFFWSKSRPNIVFIKDRMLRKNITLPVSYKQFIEDL